MISKPAPSNPGQRDMAIGICTVSLQDASRQPQPVAAASEWHMQAPGRPAPGNVELIVKVFPGVYRPQFRCFGGYPVSALMGAQDLLANPLVTIAPGAQPPPIEVTSASGGG